jgi:type I restriction enzyme S subunit
MYGIVLPGPDVNGGVPIVKGGDVAAERLSLNGLSRTSAEIEAGYVRSRLRGGDLVYAIRGSIGEVAMVPEELTGANLTQDAARISYTGDLSGRWLLYALKSNAVFAQLEAGALGATITGINIRDLKRALIPVPPFDEQRAIAAFLDRETAKIDALVAKKRRLIELLQDKRTALITRAVTKGIEQAVPMKGSGLDWLGAMPEHWQLKKLKYVVPGVTVGIVVTPAKYYVADGVPCLRGVNISGGTIDLSDLVFIDSAANELHEKSRIWEGDVLVVRTGQAGAAVIVPPELSGANCIDLLIIRRSALIRSEFLTYILNSDAARVQVERDSVGAIQSHYNTSMLADLLVALPPPDEQDRIVSFVRDCLGHLDALVETVRRGIAGLQELRAALVSAAVTGKIDVRGEAA